MYEGKLFKCTYLKVYFIWPLLSTIKNIDRGINTSTYDAYGNDMCMTWLSYCLELCMYV